MRNVNLLEAIQKESQHFNSHLQVVFGNVNVHDEGQDVQVESAFGSSEYESAS